MSINNLDNLGIYDLASTVADRLDECAFQGGQAPLTRDKWVLSSALQKMIRRGRVQAAIGVAVRLHQIDPAYLPRRLPIIAVEDIGLGDLRACFDAFTICASIRYWRHDPEQAIRFVVGSLAQAVKCRAACDAYCWSEVAVDTPHMMTELLCAPTDELVALATDRSNGRLLRSNALRVLGGISVRHGGRYQTLSRCSLPALDRVAEELSVPPLVRWLMARQLRTTGLAAMLPIAVEAAEDRVVEEGGDFPHSLEFLDGIPLCAIDMFSELGRAALREFFESSSSLKAFAAQHIRRGNHVRLFNMAMFHAESSHLNKYLVSPDLLQLRKETEHCELANLGMIPGANPRDLYVLLNVEAGRLASIRRRRLLQARGSFDGVTDFLDGVHGV